MKFGHPNTNQSSTPTIAIGEKTTPLSTAYGILYIESNADKPRNLKATFRTKKEFLEFVNKIKKKEKDKEMSFTYTGMRGELFQK